MINYISILILAFAQLFWFSPNHYSHKQAGGLDTVKTVSAIKTIFTATEAKRKSFSQYMPAALPKGELYVGYYEAEQLKMITANYYGDTGKIEADEYIENNKIVLVYAKVSDYETSISVNPRTKVKLMTENWYYLKDETLIKWVSGGKVVPAGSTQFKQQSAAMKGQLSAHKKMFSDKSLLNKIK